MKGANPPKSPDLLSPKLRVKPLKRRRVRLNDGDVESSAAELLSAIRDNPAWENKRAGLKPLPAIPSQDGETKKLEKYVSTRDVTIINDALSATSQTNNEVSRISFQTRRRRESDATAEPTQQRQATLFDDVTMPKLENVARKETFAEDFEASPPRMRRSRRSVESPIRDLSIKETSRTAPVCDVIVEKRRPRRLKPDESDARSVFSDDLNDCCDPMFANKLTSPLDPVCDVTTGIFTSPKRHKKRSRRRATIAEGDEIVSSDLGAGGLPPRRRGFSKYLPPLSENASTLK